MVTKTPDKERRQRHPVVPLTKTPNLDGEVLDKRATAMFLGFSTRTVDTWVSKKRIPFVKLPGGAIRFRRSQLIEFLKQYEVGV
jgi:excisionase family DNA binding protein